MVTMVAPQRPTVAFREPTAEEREAAERFVRGLSRRAQMPMPAEVEVAHGRFLVAWLPEEETPVAVGSYVPADDGIARVWFAVRHAHRVEALERSLLRELAVRARFDGFRELHGQVHVEDHHAFDAFQRSGYPMSCRNDGGVTAIALAIA